MTEEKDFAIAIYFGIALAFGLHSHCRTRRQPLETTETDSAANQLGAHAKAHKTPATAHSVDCDLWLPLMHLSDLWIGESNYEDRLRTTGRVEHADHLVDH